MTDEDLIDELQYGYPICRQAASRIRELLKLVDAQRNLIIETRESINILITAIGGSNAQATENTAVPDTTTQH